MPHAPTVTGRRKGGGAAREALGGTGRRLVGEAAAADGEGTAGREASDERGAARLAGLEGGGIARATPKGIVPVSPAGHSEVFPVLIPCGSRRELDSAVEKELSQKPCESCETKVKLRNLYLRNLAKLVCESCET